MLIFLRLVFGGLLAASVFCFAAFIVTRQIAWRARGVLILKWTVVAALAFFAVLIAERLAQA